MVAGEGMHSCWGACMVAGRGHPWLPGGHVWLLGACMVAGEGMHGCWGGHAWLPGGACMVARGCAWLPGGGVEGMLGCRGHVWLPGGMCGGGHVWLPGGVRGCWGACVVVEGHVWDTMRYGQ